MVSKIKIKQPRGSDWPSQVTEELWPVIFLAKKKKQTTPITMECGVSDLGSQGACPRYQVDSHQSEIQSHSTPLQSTIQSIIYRIASSILGFIEPKSGLFLTKRKPQTV